jgi:hypothetical protein
LFFEGYSAVTSIFSSSSRRAYLASSNSFSFFSISSLIKTFNLFASGPIIFLSSLDKSLIPFKISFSLPFFQRKSFSRDSRFLDESIVLIFSINSFFKFANFSFIFKS